MISLDKLEFETLIEIIKDLLNKDKGLSLNRYEGDKPYKYILQQGVGIYGGNKILCDVKNPNISDFDLLNNGLNEFNTIINEFSFGQYFLIVPKFLDQKIKKDLKERIDQKWYLEKVQILYLDDLEKLLSKYPEIENKYKVEINTWYEAYGKIAKLLNDEYLNSRDINTAQHVYGLLEKTEYFEYNSGTLGRDPEMLKEKGFDPIQLFATFNYSGIKTEKRVKCINLLFEAFQSIFKVSPTISFDGIPSPIITKIIRYRGWMHQNEIWNSFNQIFENGIGGLYEEDFNQLEYWSGINTASFTIFLFWVNSEQFLPLDQNTIRFLKEFKLITTRPKDYYSYSEVCLKIKLESEGKDEYKDIIRTFVKDAYAFTKKNTSGPVLSASTIDIITKTDNTDFSRGEIEQKAKLKKKEYFKGFRIIALKPQNKPDNKLPQAHIKNLQLEELYSFYSCFEFKDNSDQTIIYHADSDLDIYSYSDENKNLNISISSIVGKNGAGKSTLIELIYLVINKLSIYKKISPFQELEEEEVYANLYIKSDKLYKISVGDSVEIFEYSSTLDNQFELQLKNIANEFDIESFCYTLVVNYSLYGLNSKIMGPWINPLFHKNDSYSVPIVLNPMRMEGNIDINKEEYLAKSRLLANLLDPQSIARAGGIVPELVPNTTPQSLHITFDSKKMDRKREAYTKKYRKLPTPEDINKVVGALKLGHSLKDVPYASEAREYIYYKLISISEYPNFIEYKKLPNWINKSPAKLKDYIDDLFEEASHITFKLNQAINYLKYGLYQKEDYTILELSQEIDKLQESIALEKEKTTEKIKEIRTIELIPPSFFEFDIEFTYDSNFSKLSSGEKQQILSINTIAYHLYNLDSVMPDKKGYKYNSVNIVFDEIELYFHPEFQRTFIKNLRDRIISLDLHDIDNINIIFVTHSPFILSDIPKSNILMLKVDEATKKSLPYKNNDQTFGSNVHDLLANDFFMDKGFMGEFAKNKIIDLSEYLNDCFENPEKLTNDPKYTENEAREFIKLIGEPLIKDSLTDLFSYLYKNEL